MTRDEGHFILDQLAALQIQPSDITHVIVTPLQLYSISNVLAFPNATICISKRGWVHFLTSHAHPHDDRDTSIPPEILTHLVTDVWDRVRLLDDEEEIADGVRSWWSGGHHRASLAVEVDTKAGTAVLSDSFFYLENVENDRPIGISENIYECLAAHERARKADIILPLYDPKNFDRFPGGVVA
jgi:glyoxylase-like metal-dependent hydrolase (beta-lactamase superfamily II)